MWFVANMLPIDKTKKALRFTGKLLTGCKHWGFPNLTTHNILKGAVWTGLEPATPCVTGMYSNQLNYQTSFGVCKYTLHFEFAKQFNKKEKSYMTASRAPA